MYLWIPKKIWYKKNSSWFNLCNCKTEIYKDLQECNKDEEWDLQKCNKDKEWDFLEEIVIENMS